MEKRDGRGAPDPDPPVMRRRRAVVAGHDGDSDGALILSADPDPTVRSAALGALWRLGALGDDVLRDALRDSDPVVRRRACALAGRSWDATGSDGAPADGTGRGAVVVEDVVTATDDTDDSVVETAAWALGEFGARCGDGAVAALSRVATTHRSPVCRESAVAALGAIGAPGALAVVLGALEDTANIRRRAAVALAAFDDPAAEEGLRRCLSDRDWQVRQAAEELLPEG
jgi:HEAT repeat protein